MFQNRIDKWREIHDVDVYKPKQWLGIDSDEQKSKDKEERVRNTCLMEH